MRIVTYNTQGSLGIDKRRSTPRIADVVRALTPDVVCFQEVHQRLPQSAGEDQPVEFARLLGRRFVFQSNMKYGFGNYGVGIATRSAVMEVKEHFLPSEKERRGALEVRLHHAGALSMVTIFCTHWGLQVEERMRQAEALAELVRLAPRPVVVCGDLNETADAPAVRHLLTTTELLDADAERNRPTFSSDNPTARIDYILHTPDLKATYFEVVETQASDHLPVLADLEPITSESAMG